MFKNRLKPRDSGKFIAENSEHVSILHNNFDAAAKEIYERMLEEKYSMATWKQWPLHPKLMNKETVDWIFVIDSLNFSFWLPGDKQFQLDYNGKTYEDYEALCAAVNRALQEGIPITLPSYYKDITEDTVSHIFRSSNGTVLPLLDKRTEILRKNGKVLHEKFNNSFSELISKCDNDAVIAIDTILEHFETFRDFGIYNKIEVGFCKRVQILLADIWACFENQSYGHFENISELTMFPDYRVPQTLLSLRLMEYTPELMEKLRNGVVLEHNHKEEMEIRGCSIHCVELLKEKLESKYCEKELILNSVIIDFYLWDYATRNSDKMIMYPEHRTRSIFY